MMNNIIKKIKEYIYLYNISKNEDILELIYLFENNEPDEIEKELILSSRVENKNTILTEIANYIFVLYCKEKNYEYLVLVIEKCECKDFRFCNNLCPIRDACEYYYMLLIAFLIASTASSLYSSW